jgi:hypothetical protein
MIKAISLLASYETAYSYTQAGILTTELHTKKAEH